MTIIGNGASTRFQTQMPLITSCSRRCTHYSNSGPTPVCEMVSDRRVCLAFDRMHVLPQATTSYRESFRKEHFSIMAQIAKNCHRVRNGLPQSLSIRISSVGRHPHSKDAGILHSRPLDHSKSYTLTEVVPRSFRTAHWIHKTLSHGVDHLLVVSGRKHSELKTFVNGGGILVSMVL